jgi:hypothetical protein
MLRDVGWKLVTDASEKRIGPIIKGQVVLQDCPETSVTNCQHRARNVPEGGRAQKRRGGILRSRKYWHYIQNETGCAEAPKTYCIGLIVWSLNWKVYIGDLSQPEGV